MPTAEFEELGQRDPGLHGESFAESVFLQISRLFVDLHVITAPLLVGIACFF